MTIFLPCLVSSPGPSCSEGYSRCDSTEIRSYWVCIGLHIFVQQPPSCIRNHRRVLHLSHCPVWHKTCSASCLLGHGPRHVGSMFIHSPISEIPKSGSYIPESADTYTEYRYLGAPCLFDGHKLLAYLLWTQACCLPAVDTGFGHQPTKKHFKQIQVCTSVCQTARAPATVDLFLIILKSFFQGSLAKSWQNQYHWT